MTPSQVYDGIFDPKQCRAARALLGWTQQELAEKAQIGTSTVADFERGKRTPVPDSVAAMRGALIGAGIQFAPTGVRGPTVSTSFEATIPTGSPTRLINATDLSQWAARNDAKQFFPQLIERLVLASTGNRASRVQFPSEDSVQQAGWDGVCRQEVAEDLHWLPLGTSGWELGTQGSSLSGKADEDYEKRTKDPIDLVQAETTFVFATPRRFKAGAKWAREKRAEKIWRDVRVIDSDDLVTWIDLFPSVGHWLAARIGKIVQGTTPLEEFWNEWKLSTEWPMVPSIALAGRDTEATELLKWLYGQPGVHAIQSDSSEEAIAFLYAAVDQLPGQYRKFHLSRCIVAASADAARALGKSPSPLVIIMEASEPGLATKLTAQGHHVFLTYGSRVGTNDLVHVLSRPAFEAYKEALTEMGVATDRATALTRDSARKLTVLRRLIPSTVGSLTPSWAAEQRGKILVPALLAGAWDTSFEGDRSALETLSGKPFEEFGTEFHNWIDFPDAPLRYAGTTWKLASPYDAWFRLAGFIGESDLERFKTAAKSILGAPDPRFEMDSEERWLAGIRGKLPKCSPWLVSGITETLLLLSTNGNHVRAVPTAARFPDRIVQELLSGADESRWWSISPQLRTLAEVAPETFMAAVEESLSLPNRPIMALFKEDDGPLMGHAYHTNLLWALEVLAWNPDYLSRAAEILARLAILDPGGKWSNRPDASLRSIFLLWLPQTNATLAQRLKVIDRIRKVEPDAGWKLMLAIAPKSYDSGSYNPQPKWRDFSVVEPEVVTHRLVYEGACAIAQRLIEDAGINPERWAKLIEHLSNLNAEWRQRAWDQLEAVSQELTNDSEKVPIWSALRRLISMHRSHPDTQWALPPAEIDRVEKIYDIFQPIDLVLQRGWLFSQRASLLEGRRAEDWQAAEDKLSELRKQAVAELLQLDSSLLRRLINHAESPHLVGIAVGQAIPSASEAEKVLTAYLASDEPAAKEFVRGLVVILNFNHGVVWSNTLLKQAKEDSWNEGAVVEVLLALPSERRVWDAAAGFGNEINRLYWRSTNFFRSRESRDDTLYAIEQLLAVGRAHAIIDAIAGSPQEIPGATIARVLYAAAAGPWPSGGNDAVMLQWGIARLLQALDADSTISQQDVARLEWLYLALLEHSERSPVVLHRFMANDPAFFVQVLSAVFRPHSESAPKEHEPTDQEKAMATQAFRLLQSWHIAPGCTGTTVDSNALINWVKEAHKLAVQAERGAIGDQYIGQALSFSPPGSDGAWPHEAVREVIESMRNINVERGIALGRRNQRGVTTRAIFDGGAQERDLASTYRTWSEATKLEWPKTSSLLREIARSYEETARHFDDEAERTDWEY